MSIRTALGLSREGSLEEGTPDEVIEKKRRALDDESGGRARAIPRLLLAEP